MRRANNDLDSGARKQFFFEKKDQKTFVPLEHVAG
jgi:hypothetical protein